MKTLVVAEHQNGQLSRSTLSAIGFARNLAGETVGDVKALVIGHKISAVVDDLKQYAPVIAVDDEQVAQPLTDRLVAVISHVASTEKADVITAASRTRSKDVLGRAAGAMGATFAGDIVEYECAGDLHIFKKALYSGSIVARITLKGHPWFVTIRGGAFREPKRQSEPFPSHPFEIDPIDIPLDSTYLGLKRKESGRPDPADATIITAGGRAFRNADDFENLVGTLADQLGATTAASRSLVNEGSAPSEIQVGQTGKIVAPELYLALGISGSIQHIAGMKNSRVIAAVNKDRDAPIFKAADYGLIGDVYEVVPELIDKLSHKG